LLVNGKIKANGTIQSGSSIIIDGVSATRAITSDAALNVSTSAGAINLVPASGTTNVSGNLAVTGSITGTLSGNGSGLTNLNASNITSGTLADARLSSNVPLLNANNSFTGTITFFGSTTFNGGMNGNALGLTNLNASNITVGTVNDARLSSNVPLLNANNTFSGSNTFNGSSTFAGALNGNGSLLTNLNASNVSSGTLALANGGTGATTAGTARTNLGFVSGTAAVAGAATTTTFTVTGLAGTSVINVTYKDAATGTFRTVAVTGVNIGTSTVTVTLNAAAPAGGANVDYIVIP
jgi:hypothetical protein